MQRWLPNLVEFLFAALFAGLTVYGVSLIYVPAAFILAGLLCALAVVGIERIDAANKKAEAGK